MNNNQVLGVRGEFLAKKFVLAKKMKLIEQNYKCPIGELDIIAYDGDIIVFIEVKTRSSKKFGNPCEAVNYQKRRKIEHLAQYYMNTKKLNHKHARFDIIEIIDDNINYIKNAWFFGE